MIHLNISRRMQRAIGGLCLTGAFLWSQAAGAAVVVFDNQVDYEAATGPELFFIDFNGSPNAIVDGSTISPDVIFGSPEAADPTRVIWSSDALTDAGSTTAINSVGPISAEFASAAFAFALEYLSGQLDTVELFDGLGAPIDTVAPLSPSGFFGVVSDTAVGEAVFFGGIFPTTGGRDRIFIDDLRANEPLRVPEPSTLALLGLGLAGLGFAKRRLH